MGDVNFENKTVVVTGAEMALARHMHLNLQIGVQM